LVPAAHARIAGRPDLRVVIASHRASGLPEFAGNTWAFLQYVLGLDRLGVESFWVDYQEKLDPRLPTRRCRPLVREDCHSIEYVSARFQAMARKFGFDGRYCILYDGGARGFGMSPVELGELIDNVDLLLNLAGPLPAGSPLLRIPRRAYVDLDPGFTQIWAHQLDLGFGSYDFFFTVGQNVGRPEFRIPTLGIEWQPTLPPVVLDLWPAHIDASCKRLSTIGDWTGSQHAHFEGETYTGKREEFLRFLDVPSRAGRPIEPALSLWQPDYEDLGRLLQNDWCVRDPFLYAGDLESYREFIQFSRAEFSVAKGGYVKSASGWFSDRTACYLASGKPAIIQSTQLEWRLPTGMGLLTFETSEQACAVIEALDEDYLEHCHAARQIAETHFDSAAVLGSMLDRVSL
jgi:hypothetical protein